MKMLSFPINLLTSTPSVQRMTAPEFGAYMSLICTFWASGKALPKEEARLAFLARCNGKQWRHVKMVVKAAIRETMPAVETLYFEALQKAAARKQVSRVGAAASVEKRKQKANQSARHHTSLSDKHDHHTSVAPIALPPKVFHGGFHNPHEHQRAIANNAKNKGRGTMFTDG